jgi:ribosomal-protein-alanine acetyltransferase
LKYNLEDIPLNIIIEDASIRNLDRLYHIERECFKEEAFSREQIASLLADYDTISLIAKGNGEAIGFVIGMIHFERNATIGHILTIDVSPTYRQRGIATKLLVEIERIFKKKEIQTCSLEVREDNSAALSLYQKLGYERIGKLKNYYGKAADGIYLRKALT